MNALGGALVQGGTIKELHERRAQAAKGSSGADIHRQCIAKLDQPGKSVGSFAKALDLCGIGATGERLQTAEEAGANASGGGKPPSKKQGVLQGGKKKAGLPPVGGAKAVELKLAEEKLKAQRREFYTKATDKIVRKVLT